MTLGKQKVGKEKQIELAEAESVQLKVDDEQKAQLAQLAIKAASPALENKTDDLPVAASATIESSLPSEDHGPKSIQGMLPSAKWVVLFTTVACLIALPFLAVPAGTMMGAAPFAIFWAYFLSVISQAAGKRFGGKPPVSNLEIGILAVVSLLAMPLPSESAMVMALDPTFWLWLAAQAYFPFKLGRFFESCDRKNEHGLRNMGPVLGIIVAILPAAYTLACHSCLDPLTAGTSWLLSQGACLSYFVSLLTGKTGPGAIKTTKQKEEYHQGNYVLRYRSFAQIERWYHQMFDEASMMKGVKLVMFWILGPAFVVLSVLGLGYLYSSLVASSGVAKQAVSLMAGAGATASVNIAFILTFVLGSLAAALAATIYVSTKPTHLAVGEKGLRLLWRHKLWRRDGAQLFEWNKLKNIYIERPDGATSTSEDRLCLTRDDGKTLKLRLDSFDSFADREILLNGIKHWAPKVSREARVMESLQPPADYSYTELWLQALSAPPKRERFQPLVSGAQLRDGRYHVIDSLGVGGQGYAYHTKDTDNKRQVVLKEFILPVYVDVNVRKSALEQFENEARILRQLEHPQIVKLLDFFVEDHRAYLVLELIDGSSLRQIVERNGKLTEEQVRGLASQMCDLLAYLHSCSPPVVHRDFTPDNLILGKDGVLKLIDFNVAQEEAEATTTGTVVGKHAYLPPEQFRGMPVPQSDIYAFGATLQFLLTGEDPEPISVSKPQESRADVSNGLNHIVERATALELEERYQSIGETAEDLKQM